MMQTRAQENQRSRTFQKQPLNLFSVWCTLCSLARNAARELIQFHRKKKKKKERNPSDPMFVSVPGMCVGHKPSWCSQTPVP